MMPPANLESFSTSQQTFCSKQDVVAEFIKPNWLVRTFEVLHISDYHYCSSTLYIFVYINVGNLWFKSASCDLEFTHCIHFYPC